MDMKDLILLFEDKVVNASDKDDLSPAVLKKIKASIKKYGLEESENLIKAMHHAWKDGYEKGCKEGEPLTEGKANPNDKPIMKKGGYSLIKKPDGFFISNGTKQVKMANCDEIQNEVEKEFENIVKYIKAFCV